MWVQILPGLRIMKGALMIVGVVLYSIGIFCTFVVYVGIWDEERSYINPQRNRRNALNALWSLVWPLSLMYLIVQFVWFAIDTLYNTIKALVGDIRGQTSRGS